MNILDQYPSSIISRALNLKLYNELESEISEPCPCKQCGMPITKGIKQKLSLQDGFTAIDLLAAPNSQFVCVYCDSLRRKTELQEVQGYIKKPVKIFTPEEQEQYKIYQKAKDKTGLTKPIKKFASDKDAETAKNIQLTNKQVLGIIYYGGESPHYLRVTADNVMDVIENPNPNGLPFVFLIRVHHTVAQSVGRHCAWAAPVNFNGQVFRVYVPWTTVQVNSPELKGVIKVLQKMDKEKWPLYDSSYSTLVSSLARGDKNKQAPFIKQLSNKPSELILLAARIIECLNTKNKGKRITK